MYRSTAETIRGYNSFLEEQRNDGSETLVTTVLFSDSSFRLHTGIDIKLVKPLTNEIYRPNGFTALMDAVGEAVEEVRDRRSGLEKDAGGKVAFVIITDGMENASSKYSGWQVNDLIEERKKNGWEFIFLGADLTNSKDADTIGISGDRRMFFSKSRMNEAYSDTSKAIIALKKGGRIPDDWDSCFSREKPSAGHKDIDRANELYLIGPSGNKLMIDTGSPISFGDADYAQIGQNRYRLPGGSKFDDIQKYYGRDITGIIGMDILGGYNITLSESAGGLKADISEGEAVYDSGDGSRVGHIYPVMGVPTIDVQVLGMDRRFFVDTGSGMTYISERIAQDFIVSGCKEDFYPMFGIFKAVTYDFKASVQGHEFQIQAGVLPEGLKLLMPESVDGILGIDALKKFILRLDFVSGRCSVA
jgi:hypothetical protein